MATTTIYRNTAERIRRAEQLKAHRAAGNFGSARSLKDLALDHEQQVADRRARRVRRNTHNVELVRAFLACGGEVILVSYTRAIVYRRATDIMGVDHLGNILVRQGRGHVAIPRGACETRFVRPARMAYVEKLRG